MHQMFERGLNEDDFAELQDLYLSLATRTEIALRDFEKGILVAPGDVGVGISQMVPVIVASLRKQDGVLGIEQAELHVHPAIQVGMGDLFIKAEAGDEDKLISGKTARDAIVMRHDSVQRRFRLPHVREMRSDLFAPDDRKPFAGQDHFGADKNACDKPVEFAQQHAVILGRQRDQTFGELAQLPLTIGPWHDHPSCRRCVVRMAQSAPP